MAWYDKETVRFRGRLVEVNFRYGCYSYATVIKGKPINIPGDNPTNKTDKAVLICLFKIIHHQGLTDIFGDRYHFYSNL
jgi:hypothetical protein